MKNLKKQNDEFHVVRKRSLFLIFLFVLCVLVAGIFLFWQKAREKAGFGTPVIISIENDYLSRIYLIKDGHINTNFMINKRIDGGKTIALSEGSEDFVIRLFDENAPSMELDKTGWKISIQNRDGVEFPQNEAVRLIDGSTLIHPQIEGGDYEKAPFTVDLDLGSVQTIRSFSIDKRSGDCEEADSVNGTMGKFKLYVSEDGINYTPAGEGEFTEEAYNLHEDAGICLSHFSWEDHLYNVGERVYANFDDAYTTRYVRLVQETCAVGTTDDAFSSAEITLYEDAYTGKGTPDVDKTTIMASELRYKGVEEENTDGIQKLIIHYAPYQVNGSTYDIDQVAVLGKDDFYLRSFLEIHVSEKEKARIDYIDMNRFLLPENLEDVWDEGMYAIGQPLYAGGLFFGSEFPVVRTWISHENTTQLRYYSGKSFARMEADGQLDADGKFVTWQGVIGAARDTDISVVQSDFYRYIEEIAAPTDFRKQYNSWFCAEMEITEESMEEAFLGAEKGLAQNGIEPLDCYVVDDGWNNYYDGIYLTAKGEQQGTTENATGFWETNAKFPNEMYPASELSGQLQSTFGMWLGPQGGYVYDKTFSQFLEASGTGHVRTEKLGDGTTAESYLCVASDTYIDNLRTLFFDYNTKYDITYWKVDGLGSSCMNPAHGHMTGGYCDMYYTSDMWEKWIALFEDIRAARSAEGRDLFINATNGTVLSPWILQWVNTVWLNMGEDTGTIGTGERFQQKIYYRDQSYYRRFGGENPIQFPLGHLYNHDPIYALADKKSASPKTFREYLFANAMRGTQLWEMYYTPSLMKDTYWQIAADVLTWAEENHEILKNARYFGNDPTEGVYGYACFDGNQGIISFTNPLDKEQTYKLLVDGSVGADRNLAGAAGFQVYPYEEKNLDKLSYGDTITVKLKPHQTVVWQYGLIDTEAPEVLFARSEGKNEIRIKFNERIYLDVFTMDVSMKGISADATLAADYRTVVFQTEESLEGPQQVYVHVRDMSENVYEALVTVQCCGEDNAYELSSSHALAGSGPFTISTEVQTKASGQDIVTVGDDVKLSIEQNGYVCFQVGDVEFTSEKKVTAVTKKASGIFGTDAYVPEQTEMITTGQINDGKTHTITAVREANGILKLYIDGKLCASCYDREKRNEELQGGVITIADDIFRGEPAEVTILNKALGYDEIMQ